MTTALSSCLGTAMSANATNAFVVNPTDVPSFNTGIPVHPVAIAYPTTTEQVSDIVKCATAGNMTVQAKSGGHGYANYAYGGGDTNIVTIDLQHFQDFSMNQTDWTATVGAGTLLGNLTERLLDAGSRAMAYGLCPSVGIGGHATIGGLGPPSRMWGAALDHILEVEAVLANGSIVTASPTQNTDLFWGIRGAAASMAIVTSFKVRTQAAPGTAVQYSFGFTFSSWSEIGTQFKAWQSLISQPDLDRRFASMFILQPLGAIITGTFFGSKEEWDAMNVTSVFPNGPDPDITVFDDWLGLLAHWGEDEVLSAIAGKSAAFFANSLAITRPQMLSDATVDAMFKYIDDTDIGTPAWFTVFDLAGGFVNDVPMNATGYAHRDALFYLQSYVVSLTDQVSDTTRGFLQGLNGVVQNGTNGTFGVYAGYVDPTLSDAQELYWGGNLPELERVKRRWDPGDVFHTPQGVRPA